MKTFFIFPVKRIIFLLTGRKMTRFFPVVSGEIFYWKIRFPGNIKSYPTLVLTVAASLRGVHVLVRIFRGGIMAAKLKNLSASNFILVATKMYLLSSKLHLSSSKLHLSCI